MNAIRNERVSTFSTFRRRLYQFQERHIHYWLIFPGMAVITAVLIYPLAYSFYISFFDYRLARTEVPFVGFGNYSSAITNYAFHTALIQNVAYSLICLIIEFLLGMGLALLLNIRFKGRGLVRALFLLPMLTAPILAGFNWRWILNDSFGVINQLLNTFGSQPVGWLVTPNNARFSIILATIWQGIPFVMLLLLAGLQALPVEPYEAAIVDGASSLQRFRFITLPLLKPVIVVVLALRIIDLFRVFDVIYIMTLGGPGRATELLPYYIYRTAFSESRMGYASAISWMTMIITLLFLIPLFKLERSE